MLPYRNSGSTLEHIFWAVVTLCIILGLVVLWFVLRPYTFQLPWEEDSASATNASPELKSGIMGTVFIGPNCPTAHVPADPGCIDKPYATKLTVLSGDEKKTIASVTSDTHGRFRASLPPGDYVIRSMAAATTTYCSNTTNIYVDANVVADVVVRCQSVR